jgi:cytosine/adenosine deaminase-related metal-dependent hydrolase
MVPVTLHQARRVVPVAAPPVENGAVAVSQGRILAVGRASDLRRRFSGPCLDHGEAAILPGLVNAHVHLEFSPLKGRIPPRKRLGDWLIAAMAGFAALTPPEQASGVRDGIAELQRFGTSLAAEVSNTCLSLDPLRDSSLEFHYFYELLGFDLIKSAPLDKDFVFLNAPAVQRNRYFSVAAHAPYSVSASLCRRIAAWNEAHNRPNAIHLAESRQEVQFLRRGNGFFRQLLQTRGRWRQDWQPPGCTPTAYLDRLGFLHQNTLAAHGLFLTAADREILARRGTWVVLCPRSNEHTGAGFPDLTRLRQAGVRLALGTDSLASNTDLNLFREMTVLRERYPDFPPGELLALGTLHGAQALGRDGEFGSLAPGKRAALLRVPLDGGSDFWASLFEAGAAGRMEWLVP